MTNSFSFKKSKIISLKKRNAFERRKGINENALFCAYWSYFARDKKKPKPKLCRRRVDEFVHTVRNRTAVPFLTERLSSNVPLTNIPDEGAMDALFKKLSNCFNHTSAQCTVKRRRREREYVPNWEEERKEALNALDATKNPYDIELISQKLKRLQQLKEKQQQKLTSLKRLAEPGKKYEYNRPNVETKNDLIVEKDSWHKMEKKKTQKLHRSKFKATIVEEEKQSERSFLYDESLRKFSKKAKKIRDELTNFPPQLKRRPRKIGYKRKQKAKVKGITENMYTLDKAKEKAQKVEGSENELGNQKEKRQRRSMQKTKTKSRKKVELKIPVSKELNTKHIYKVNQTKLKTQNAIEIPKEEEKPQEENEISPNENKYLKMFEESELKAEEVGNELMVKKPANVVDEAMKEMDILEIYERPKHISVSSSKEMVKKPSKIAVRDTKERRKKPIKVIGKDIKEAQVEAQVDKKPAAIEAQDLKEINKKPVHSESKKLLNIKGRTKQTTKKISKTSKAINSQEELPKPYVNKYLKMFEDSLRKLKMEKDIQAAKLKREIKAQKKADKEMRAAEEEKSKVKQTNAVEEVDNEEKKTELEKDNFDITDIIETISPKRLRKQNYINSVRSWTEAKNKPKKVEKRLSKPRIQIKVEKPNEILEKNSVFSLPRQQKNKSKATRKKEKNSLPGSPNYQQKKFPSFRAQSKKMSRGNSLARSAKSSFTISKSFSPSSQSRVSICTLSKIVNSSLLRMTQSEQHEKLKSFRLYAMDKEVIYNNPYGDKKLRQCSHRSLNEPFLNEHAAEVASRIMDATSCSSKAVMHTPRYRMPSLVDQQLFLTPIKKPQERLPKPKIPRIPEPIVAMEQQARPLLLSELLTEMRKSESVEELLRQIQPNLLKTDADLNMEKPMLKAKAKTKRSPRKIDVKSSQERACSSISCRICSQLGRGPPRTPRPFYMQQMQRQLKAFNLRSYYKQMMLHNCCALQQRQEPPLCPV